MAQHRRQWRSRPRSIFPPNAAGTSASSLLRSSVDSRLRAELELAIIWVYLSGVWRGRDMAGGFSFVVPMWVVIPVLLLLVLGGFKLVKLVLMALKG